MSQDPLTPHDVIASRLRELRKGRGWSAQQLADELSKIGVAWDRSIVANFENRRRRAVSVEEFLALAFVLSVAPIHLLVPPVGADDMTPYAVTPTINSWPAFARAWIRGLEPMGGTDPRRYFSEVPEAEWQPPQEWSQASIERFGAAHDRIKARESEEGQPDGR